MWLAGYYVSLGIFLVSTWKVAATDFPVIKNVLFSPKWGSNKGYVSIICLSIYHLIPNSLLPWPPNFSISPSIITFSNYSVLHFRCQSPSYLSQNPHSGQIITRNPQNTSSSLLKQQVPDPDSIAINLTLIIFSLPNSNDTDDFYATTKMGYMWIPARINFLFTNYHNDSLWQNLCKLLLFVIMSM